MSRPMPQSNQPQAVPEQPRQGRSLDPRRKSEFASSSLDARAGARFEPSDKAQILPFVKAGQNAGPASPRVPQNLPAEIAFLAHYGIAPGILVAAAAKARAQGVSADAVLLAEGQISEYHFYRSLARHLRLDFVEGLVTLGSATHYPQSIKAGLAPLVGPSGPAYLGAPRGAAISQLVRSLRRNHSLPRRLALTTPTCLGWSIAPRVKKFLARRACGSRLSIPPFAPRMEKPATKARRLGDCHVDRGFSARSPGGDAYDLRDVGEHRVHRDQLPAAVGLRGQCRGQAAAAASRRGRIADLFDRDRALSRSAYRSAASRGPGRNQLPACQARS